MMPHVLHQRQNSAMIDSLKHVWRVLGWRGSHAIAWIRWLTNSHIYLILVLLAMTACLFAVMLNKNNIIAVFQGILITHTKKDKT